MEWTREESLVPLYDQAQQVLSQQNSNNSSPLYRLGQGTAIGGSLADLGSTVSAINNGAHESNPVNGDGNIGRLALTHGLTTAATLAAMHLLAKNGHDKAAGVLGMIAGSIPAVAAVHNMRLK